MSDFEEATHNIPCDTMSPDDLEDTTQENQKSSPLLRLPAELRTLIYEFAFLDSRVSVAPITSDTASSAYRDRDVQRSPLALRQTCRQIRHETRAVFFEHVIFDFSVHGIRTQTASDLGSDTVNSIRSIHLSAGLSSTLNVVAHWSKVDQDEFVWNMPKIALVGLRHVYIERSADRQLDAGQATFYEAAFQNMLGGLFGHKLIKVHIGEIS